MAEANVFRRVSTDFWRRQTRVSAVPISFDAPEEKDEKLITINKDISGSSQLRPRRNG